MSIFINTLKRSYGDEMSLVTTENSLQTLKIELSNTPLFEDNKINLSLVLMLYQRQSGKKSNRSFDCIMNTVDLEKMGKKESVTTLTTVVGGRQHKTRLTEDVGIFILFVSIIDIEFSFSMNQLIINVSLITI